MYRPVGYKLSPDTEKPELRALADCIVAFPQPTADKYDSYLDYEQAALDWASAVQKALGKLQLPVVMGRHYFRPRVLPDFGFLVHDLFSLADNYSVIRAAVLRKILMSHQTMMPSTLRGR